jgi:hypothetical protein
MSGVTAYALTGAGCLALGEDHVLCVRGMGEGAATSGERKVGERGHVLLFVRGISRPSNRPPHGYYTIITATGLLRVAL